MPQSAHSPKIGQHRQNQQEHHDGYGTESAVTDFGSNADRQAAMSAETPYRNASDTDGYGSRQSIDEEDHYNNGAQAAQPQLDADGDPIEYKNLGEPQQPLLDADGDPIEYKNDDGAQAPAQQPPAPQADPRGPLAPGLSRMPERYVGEDQNFRQSRLDDTKESKVHYLDDQEKADAKLNIDKQTGTLKNKDGNGLTTSGSHDVLRNAMDDAHLWAMDGSGETRQASSAPRDLDATHHEVMHHSSLVGGGDVKCAGEMQTKDGYIQQLNNHSGHYQPNDKQFLDATQELDKQGVNLDATHIQPHQAGGDYIGAGYLASGGNLKQMDAKKEVNKQIEGFDKSSLKHDDRNVSPV